MQGNLNKVDSEEKKQIKYKKKMTKPARNDVGHCPNSM